MCGERILIKNPTKYKIKHKEYKKDVECDGTLMMLSIQPSLRKK